MQLSLENGSTSTGQLRACSTDGYFAWQADGFEEPFEFDLGQLRFISPLKERDAANETAAPNLFELSDGGLIAGQLLSIDDKWVTVRCPVVGDIPLRRQSVLTIVDSSYAGKIVYSGPRDDGKWSSVSKRGDSTVWRYDGGRLLAGGPGGTVIGNIGLPAKCRIQLSLAWDRGIPDFVIAVGTTGNSESTRVEELESAVTVEVWDQDLAIVRETRPLPPIGDEETEEGESDFQMLTSFEKGARSLEFVLYVDQIAGRIIACDSHGRRLAEMVVPPKSDFRGTAIQIANTGASLSLAGIEAREWDGLTTQGGGAATAVLQSGTISASVTGFDAATNHIILEAEDGERRVPLAEVWRGEFRPSLNEPDRDASVAASDAGQVELLLGDRSRLFGTLLPSSDDQIRFKPVQAKSTIEVSLEHILGLAGTPSREPPSWPAGRRGTLKVDGAEIEGCLAEHGPSSSAVATLSWHPLGSQNAAALSPTATGAIIYRAPIPKAAPKKPRIPNGDDRRFFRARRTPPPAVMPSLVNVKMADQPQISFRTGDIISATVESIDENGVEFRSPHSTTEHAAHSQIQSITLTPLDSDVFLPEEKFNRLMTVPRLMKDDPPTHLLIAPTGDYLRGRLISVAGDQVTLAVGVENVEIPRKNIARIVWLHDREWKGDDPNRPTVDAEPAAEEDEFMVHAIRSGDRGLTFEPRQVSGGKLMGVSNLLGDCTTEIESIDQLLFGSDIEARVREYRDDPWTLALARLPRVFAEADGSLAAGQQSPLVGQAAPHFVLRDIDGKEFILGAQRPKVVVLDFWASWCGPCMQSMPQVERIVNELGSDQVELVAVNVQEVAPKARAAINRLDISPTVVLDSDGEVSAAYGARAIPQTVVVDAQGTVTHVFVGGGKRVLDQLRQALSEMLVL
ncbi:MAG: TlpA disulfide reductase family protein [Aureliella sp.]